MKRILILACLCGAALAQTRAGREIRVQQKLALVIGNGAYPGNVLKNPVNDAAAVAMASLEDAIGVFAGPTVEKVDDRHDYGEIRSQTALRSP